jgi:predicted ATPase
MLLILDNCEHLIDESARVASELLASCPRLRLIATSRERLGVAGECLWSAPPLTLERAADLFAIRAAEVAPGFALSDETAPIVRSICARLDGMPLAIELAAARARAFPVGQIAERLDNRFRLLPGGARTAAQRQQTLRAVVDWSCDLLSDSERRLFYRLSVFVDGSDLEAVEAVCSDELVPRDDVADLLARLVDKSLVVSRDEDGRARLLLLQTLAEYGRERIAETGERSVLRGRHAGWYGTVADGGIPAMFGRQQRRWLRTVRRELGNLRQALDWAVDTGDAELAQGITGNLGVFF